MKVLLLSNQWLALISQPWHWAVAGAALTLIVFLMNWLGKRFGISGSYEVACSLLGAGKKIPFFRRDFKEDIWVIVFVLGTVLGGYIAAQYLSGDQPVAISQSTIDYLAGMGISYPQADSKGLGMIPDTIFSLSNPKGVLLAVIGGLLVGFGARYGRGCTSGHAISGLAHLQLPSLITVIGFFIGGLLMTHFVFPWIMSL